MPHTDEKALNTLLAQALNERHPRWEASAEQSRVLRDQPALTPDIIITPVGGGAGHPVVLETEYEPASTVNNDALARIGVVLERSGHTVEQVVAVRIPVRLATLSSADLPIELNTAKLGYRLVRQPQGATKATWFPETGWIRGTVDDLAGFCERIALNEHLVDQAANRLEQEINSVTRGLHDQLDLNRGAVFRKIAEALHQDDDPQTTRMGVTVIANALLFQMTIAGTEHVLNDGSLYTVPSLDPNDSRVTVLNNWSNILLINYWPIFHIARKVLHEIPDREAKIALKALIGMVSDLAGYGVTSTGDMAGQMFGKLIADRKFLATFYTRPASAHLLAELAVARLATDWANRDQVTSLRVADLACGTGTLLTATYQRIIARIRRAGTIDAQSIHPKMIEKGLVGADIMPAAIHLTATLLSSTHPTEVFGDTSIFLMPYGAIDGSSGNGVEVGSLELLAENFDRSLDLFNDSRKLITSKDSRRTEKVLNHNTADLIIMNPPFTRPTNHETAAAAGVPVPSFAGFGTEAEEQRLMSGRLKKLNQKITDPVGHGNAGLGSNFIDLAHVKIRPGGVVAFVLPFTVVSGEGWSKTRALLSEHYRNICVVAIATTGLTDRSFSADTGMAEVLIIATRLLPTEEPDTDNVLWVNLNDRPMNLVEAVDIARQIAEITQETRRRRSGSVDIGDTLIGNFIRSDISDGGCAGTTEADLAVCASSLVKGQLSLPRLGDIDNVALTRLGQLGKSGLVDRDINGYQADRTTPRGPFDIEPIANWKAASYPALWNHDASREKQLIVNPDSQGRIRDGCNENAQVVWNTATQLHFNRDFQVNSQPLTACLTPGPSLGGTAWPNFKLYNEAWQSAVLLWANTSLGLISFWWIGTRQHQGRARLTISRLPALMTLDPRTLTTPQLNKADDIFDQFKERAFLPASEAYRDEARRALDEAVLVDLLELKASKVMPPLAVLREQWCREPSVHGGKDTRPEE